MAEIKKISTEFQLLNKFLDTSGDAGSANQVLVSTATGINWVDGSGSSIIGGPYLPVANPTFTGTLTGPNATFTSGVTVTGSFITINPTGNAILNVNGTADSFVEKDTGNDLYIANNVGDKDIKFRVKDNTTNVVALTIDGSEGGNATFAGDITTSSNLAVIQTPRISMEADGTLDWGGAKDVGTLTWDTGYAYLKGQVGKGVKIQIDNSTTALTIGTSANATFAGKITASGGIDGLTLANGGISGSNYNITGVNQLEINDPGEGIVFLGTTTMYLNAVDDATDSILQLRNATQLNLNSTARITNLVDPINAQDAATKNYVDTEVGNIPSGLSFEGNWNASTDTPSLAGTTPGNGIFYIVSVAGSTSLSGITDWAVGDWAVFVSNGAGTDAWQKVDNSSTLSGFGDTNQVTYWTSTGNVAGDTNFSYDGTNLTVPRLRVGDGTDGYFYSDSGGRTAFRDGDFYIQDTVSTYYNYATTQYHGASSGDNHLFRGNTLSGNNWNITAAGVATFADLLTVNGDGHLFLGATGETPKIDMLYTTNGSGRGWDTRIFTGKTDDLPNGQAFPTSTIAGGFGTQYQANSDGAFFGIIPYTTGHYRPVINWGDDAADSPFSFQFNGVNKATVSSTGVITSLGGSSTEWNTAYDNSITTFTDSGTSTVTLTLTQQDGGTLSTSFSVPQGTVTGGPYLPLTGGTLTGALTGTSASFTGLQVIGDSITRSKTRGLGTNYTTSEGWVAGAAGSFTSRTGYFGGDFTNNGPSAENKIEYDIGPFGSRELVWMSVAETASNDDGGWNKSLDGFNNSANNGFMSIVYVRRDAGAAAGNFYHGCSGSNTLNLAGSIVTNPYFSATGASILPADVWCVAIGIIYATNDTTATTSALGGIYRLDTGEKLQGATTYRQKTSNVAQQQRVYHYYSTSPSAQLDFANPGWYILDGSEPSLGEILGSNQGDGVFLPLAGGTLTGGLAGTTATFSGNITLSGGGARTIQSGGDIALKTSTGEYALYGAANGNTNIYYNGDQHFRTGPDGVVVTGNIELSTINNATTDTDKFLVSDSGVVKYRTGAQVLSDIGGASASYINAATFQPNTGVITGTGVGSAGFTVDIDGRYPVGNVLNTEFYLALQQNPVGTTYGNGVSTVPTYYFGQKAGGSDAMKFYAESAASNDITAVWEINDDIETGLTWLFRNKKTYSPYTATDALKIDGDGDVTVGKDLTITGGDIILSGTTGRIQGIETITDSTDAVNKAYVDARDGTVTSVNVVTDGDALNVTSNTITDSGTMTLPWQGGSDQYVNGLGNVINLSTIPQGTVTGTGTANILTKWNSAGTGIEDTSISVVESGPARLYTINGVAGTSSGINLLRLNKDTGGSSDSSFLFRVGTTQNDIVSDSNYNTGLLRFRLANAAGTESTILSLNANGDSIFSGNVTVGANTTQNGTNPGLKIQSTNTSQTVLGLHNTTSRNWEVAVGGSANGIGAGSFYIYDNTASDARFIIDTSGNATVDGTVTANGVLLTGGGEGVTSVATTSPILGGTITTSGTISLLQPASGAWFRGVSVIGSDGLMEVGKYIDFHSSNTGTSDFDARLTASSGQLQLSGTFKTTSNLIVSGLASFATTNTDAKVNIAQGTGSVATNVLHASENSFRLSTKVGTNSSSQTTPIFQQSLYYGLTENAGINYYRGGSTTGGRLAFSTNDGTEKMFISSSGKIGLNEDDPSALLHVKALAPSGTVFKLIGDPATTANQMLIYTTKAFNSSDSWYNLICEAGNGSGSQTSTLIIERDGDVLNKNNTYGQISDSRLKENIQDATPKLDDVMKVKVKNFNFIGEDLKQIGVVAQELEEVFPGLVKEDKQPDLNGEEGGIYKSVKYSVLVPILVKAMQEQQEIIEDLKTRITKLEN